VEVTIDLQRYGLAEQWSRLSELQGEVSSLTQRRDKARREVEVARQALEAARQKDAEVAAKALRKGGDMPKPQAEEKARKHLEAQERTYAAFVKAVEDATAELGSYQAQHSAEIRESLIAALRKQAETLAQHAQEATQIFGLLEDSRYVLKDLAPPPEAEDYTGPAARLSTYVMGVQVTQSAGTTDPPRGDVEATLAYLTSLQERFVVADGEQGGEDAA
jgi:hypothetical protein